MADWTNQHSNSLRNNSKKKQMGWILTSFGACFKRMEVQVSLLVLAETSVRSTRKLFIVLWNVSFIGLHYSKKCFIQIWKQKYWLKYYGWDGSTRAPAQLILFGFYYFGNTFCCWDIISLYAIALPLASKHWCVTWFLECWVIIQYW